MTPATEEAGFLTAILADPGDDTARLVYADWLDEQEWETVPCPECGTGSEPGWVHRHGSSGPGYYPCRRCTDLDNGERRGTGTVVVPADPSKKARAAFIRAQCELEHAAKCDPPMSRYCECG